MDSVSLRKILRPLVIALSGYNTHAMLPDVCQHLGLPDPNFGGSKRERMTASFDELQDEDLPSVAAKFL